MKHINKSKVDLYQENLLDWGRNESNYLFSSSLCWEGNISVTHFYSSEPYGEKVAEYLKIKYNFESISTGNILRERALKDENLANLMKTGALISDEIILNIMKDKLATMKNDFILDGVPRTLNQAKILTNMLNELNIKFKVV